MGKEKVEKWKRRCHCGELIESGASDEELLQCSCNNSRERNQKREKSHKEKHHKEKKAKEAKQKELKSKEAKKKEQKMKESHHKEKVEKWKRRCHCGELIESGAS